MTGTDGIYFKDVKHLLGRGSMVQVEIRCSGGFSFKRLVQDLRNMLDFTSTSQGSTFR